MYVVLLSEAPCYVWTFHFLQRVVLAWFRSWRLRAALGLPHDFATEHSLISLHVWILHNRFRLDYDGRGILCGRYVASVHDFCLRSRCLWEVVRGIMKRFPACFGLKSCSFAPSIRYRGAHSSKLSMAGCVHALNGPRARHSGDAPCQARAPRVPRLWQRQSFLRILLSQ